MKAASLLTTRLSLALLTALATLVPVHAARGQESEPVIRITQVDNSNFPEVTVYLSVTDAAGQPLAVDPSSIQIFEDGQLMTPQQMSGAGEIGALTTLLVMDVSGSMWDAGKLAAAQAAALAYVDQMRPGDQAGLLAFNTEVSYVQAVTADQEALRRAISSLEARGDTALYDALDQGIQILGPFSGRKAIIALSDGLDNRSQRSADDVIQAAGAGQLSISTIGLGDPEKLGINAGLNEPVLQSLASSAGGVYGYANEAEALRRLYEGYGYALRSEYTITYTSPSALRDGINRRLTVSLGGSAAASEAQYNPGGVLPEVAGGASWPIFLIFLAVLVGLLFVPGLIGRLQPGKARAGFLRRRKPRIKLK
jgi:VWFA-related protein